MVSPIEDQRILKGYSQDGSPIAGRRFLQLAKLYGVGVGVGVRNGNGVGLTNGKGVGLRNTMFEPAPPLPSLDSFFGSSRRENVGRPTIFITHERDRNDAPISSCFLRKIRDLKKVILRNIDHQRRTRAGDNLALERIGKRKACCSQDNERNRTAGGEDLHA